MIYAFSHGGDERKKDHFEEISGIKGVYLCERLEIESFSIRIQICDPRLMGWG